LPSPQSYSFTVTSAPPRLQLTLLPPLSSVHIKGPFGRAYFSASALAHAKVVSNTSFSNGFTSEVLFQNELEGMSQKKVAHPASAHVIFAQ
jgi:hypothetical protein